MHHQSTRHAGPSSTIKRWMPSDFRTVYKDQNLMESLENQSRRHLSILMTLKATNHQPE